MNKIQKNRLDIYPLSKPPPMRPFKKNKYEESDDYKKINNFRLYLCSIDVPVILDDLHSDLRFFSNMDSFWFGLFGCQILTDRNWLQYTLTRNMNIKDFDVDRFIEEFKIEVNSRVKLESKKLVSFTI